MCYIAEIMGGLIRTQHIGTYVYTYIHQPNPPMTQSITRGNWRDGDGLKMCIYDIYVHTYKYACMYAHIHTYVYYIQRHTYTYAFTYTCIYICMYIHIHIRVHVCTYIHIYIYM